MVLDDVSMSHPRMIFWVDQKSSPLSSFLTEIGCFLSSSRSSLGLKTLSMAWKVVRWTRMQLNHPCAALIKSSIHVHIGERWTNGAASWIGNGSGSECSKGT